MNVTREEVLQMVADKQLQSVDVYGVPYIVEEDANRLAEMRFAARQDDTSLISYRIVAERIGCEPIEVLHRMFGGEIPYVRQRSSLYMTPETFEALVQRFERNKLEASNNASLANRFTVTENR